MLALPSPSAGPPLPPLPPPTHPGTRPPFIPSTGVGNVPAMGVGRGVVNGGSSTSLANGANSGPNQPSVSDIAAGAILIASVVQGRQRFSNKYFHGGTEVLAFTLLTEFMKLGPVKRSFSMLNTVNSAIIIIF